MILKCTRPECGYTGETEIKMGGLLCGKCRVILKQPYVDPEYFEELARLRAKTEQMGKEETNADDGTASMDKPA